MRFSYDQVTCYMVYMIEQRTSIKNPIWQKLVKIVVVAKAVTVAVEWWYKKTHTMLQAWEKRPPKKEVKAFKNDKEKMAKGKITEGGANDWPSASIIHDRSEFLEQRP